jgi:hypothetical protein
MQSFQLKSYNSQCSLSGHHFFILNKGLNSGKPLTLPCPNCFVFTASNAADRDFFYWLCFGLWQSNSFHPFLRGSVIPFIVLEELKQCIREGASQARENLPEFRRSVELLKVIELKEKQFNENLRLLHDAKRAVFYRYMRKRK